MHFRNLAAAGMIAAATISLGCDDSSSTTAPPANAPTAAEGVAAERSKATVGDLQPQMDAAQNRVDTAIDGATTRAAAAADGAKTAAGDAGNAVATQAQALYDQAKTAINSAKWEDAQRYVDQLVAMRAKLPADWQVRVDEVSKMLTDAKAKLGGMSAPSMPK